jgi:hypothetical protein
VLVALSYMLRGLTIGREAGAVKGKGSAKLSWVTSVSGISERAAAYARAELIACGFLTPDESSTQRKLNRDGAYFRINLEFRALLSGGKGTKVSQTATTPRDFAPRVPVNPPVFAPPYKDRKTSSIEESKNQKAPGAEAAGVFKKGKEGAPNLRNIRLENLWRFSDVESLYFQACAAGLVKGSEAKALEFLAAAVRARSVKDGEPVRVFVGIIRKGLWHHITQADEDTARRALVRFRERAPERFRFSRAAA